MHEPFTVYNVADDAEVSMTGTVTKMEWMNPHIHFYIDVTDENGNVVNYAVEGGTPNSLYRRGWRKDVLPIGSVVTIEGAASLFSQGSLDAKVHLRRPRFPLNRRPSLRK